MKTYRVNYKVLDSNGESNGLRKGSVDVRVDNNASEEIIKQISRPLIFGKELTDFYEIESVEEIVEEVLE